MIVNKSFLLKFISNLIFFCNQSMFLLTKFQGFGKVSQIQFRNDRRKKSDIWSTGVAPFIESLTSIKRLR